MGHGPSLKSAIAASQAAQKEVNTAIESALQSLANTEQKANDYITSHTTGIVKILAINNNAFSKFSDEFDLSALDSVVDGLVKAAQDYVNPKGDDTKAADMAGDLGQVAKSTLALFASSSTTNQQLQIVFNNILADETNFAVYYATNSMNVFAANAFGKKSITVVTNMYMLAEVKPDPAVTMERIYQQDLDTLGLLNQQFDKAILDATLASEIDALNLYQRKMQILKDKITQDQQALISGGGTPK